MPSPPPTTYVGRFAPTPSGPLHFGSLVAAVGSFLDARAVGGRWLLRIEDLDPPRVRPGAEASILRSLETHGLTWDGPVVRQSERFDLYADAVDRLAREGRLRECPCTRAALSALPQNQSRPREDGDELFHPAVCSVDADDPATPPGRAQRLRVRAGEPVEFVDRSLGACTIDVAATVGDFVLRRRDGLFAYQLAVVVDDAEQGITDVVRGADLLSSTARQVLVQRSLGLPTVRYLHLPLAVDDRGRKLSKSEDAPAATGSDPSRRICDVLRFLGQAPPDGLERDAIHAVWAWATAHWEVGRFEGCASGAITTGEHAGLAG